jgi:hypothetical protein
MKSIIAVWGLLCLFFSSVYSQEQDYVNRGRDDRSKSQTSDDDRFFDANKFYGGGNIGLSFGGAFVFEISPQVYYSLHKRFHVGAGATYIYYQERFSSFKTNVTGGRIMANAFIFPFLFVHAEYEGLNGEWVFGRRSKITSVLAGFGFRQTFTKNSGFDIMLLWNFSDPLNYPYGNPLFRAGFIFPLN